MDQIKRIREDQESRMDQADKDNKSGVDWIKQIQTIKSTTAENDMGLWRTM